MHIHIFLVFRSCTDIRFPEAQWSPEYIIENSYMTSIGVGAGPAGQVLAGPLLSKVKMKLHFCKKQAMNRSASMIIRLVRLIIS